MLESCMAARLPCACLAKDDLLQMWMISRASLLLLKHATCTEQVEDEMRELLSVMEQQKAASAAKVRQLATILQDMHSPALH